MTQIASYNNQNRMLSLLKSGFQTNFNCFAALNQITDAYFASSDKHLCIVLVLLDFSKAFELNNHFCKFYISVAIKHHTPSYLCDKGK